MRLSTIISVLLPVAAVLAAPTAPIDVPITDAIPAERLALREGEDAGLVARKNQVCKIVGTNQVNCRYQPTTKAGAILGFPRGSKHEFSCYKIGECINGNCTWDWAENWNCFVSGYYTDSNCSRAKLKRCA
ncbi:hypothetical protein V502_08843 [Pseudogymnoascus sp. VKM F-4520 (FW-2644)]|nr:hypothetical protein V502_08843 [Pseudogymnoascus sp. VKM F-4520 (FW-2644)]